MRLRLPMADPTASRTAALGLVVLAVLAWTLPCALRGAKQLLAPPPPVIYGEAGSFAFRWSPEGAVPVSDGRLRGADGTTGRALGGWEGLLFGRPLDLNRAGRDDLEALPGIGPKTAAAILEAREARGGFQTVEDLLRVRGIGPKTLEGLRPLVTVGEGSGKEAGEAGQTDRPPR